MRLTQRLKDNFPVKILLPLKSGDIWIKPGKISHHLCERKIPKLTMIIQIFHMFPAFEVERVINRILEAIKLQGF